MCVGTERQRNILSAGLIGSGGILFASTYVAISVRRIY